MDAFSAIIGIPIALVLSFFVGSIIRAAFGEKSMTTNFGSIFKSIIIGLAIIGIIAIILKGLYSKV